MSIIYESNDPIELGVGKSISETLNIDKKKATIGLKVETTGSLLFSVKGGVKVTLYSLQNERMIVLSCAKYQDTEWDEKTALFDAIPGYYYSDVELQDGEEDASFICSVTAVQNDNDENVDDGCIKPPN
jgi:hypothetical protein